MNGPNAGYHREIYKKIADFIDNAPVGHREVMCKAGCDSWDIFERASNRDANFGIIGAEISGRRILWRKLAPKPQRKLKFMTENRV